MDSFYLLMSYCELYTEKLLNKIDIGNKKWMAVSLGYKDCESIKNVTSMCFYVGGIKQK